MGISLRLLDLFCGAGGASVGYRNVFDDIHGVDIRKQPHYPYRFTRADAATFPIDGYDLVHASPPCQDHSRTRFLFIEPEGSGWLLEHTIERAIYQGVCYVVENVMDSWVPNHPHQFTLCAATLGPWIRNPRKLFLGKHRKFWSNVPIPSTECRCDLARECGYRMGTLHTNRNGHYTRKDEFSRIIDIDWMTNKEMQQAIPPYYTRYIANEWVKWRYGIENVA